MQLSCRGCSGSGADVNRSRLRPAGSMTRRAAAVSELTVLACTVARIRNGCLMLLQADSSLLLLVDTQTRLAPAIHDADAAVRRCRLLIEAAKRLEVPVLAVEQYPEGLGPTVPELAAAPGASAGVCEAPFLLRRRAADRRGARGARAPDRGDLRHGGAHLRPAERHSGCRPCGFAPVVVADAVASRRAGLARDRAAAAAAATASRSSPPRWWSTSGCARPPRPLQGDPAAIGALNVELSRPDGHWPG